MCGPCCGGVAAIVNEARQGAAGYPLATGLAVALQVNGCIGGCLLIRVANAACADCAENLAA
jgi:hypothetical protein